MVGLGREDKKDNDLFYTCSLIDYGVCGDEECESCHWRCPECGGCTHPEGEKQP